MLTQTWNHFSHLRGIRFANESQMCWLTIQSLIKYLNFRRNIELILSLLLPIGEFDTTIFFNESYLSDFQLLLTHRMTEWVNLNRVIILEFEFHVLKISPFDRRLDEFLYDINYRSILLRKPVQKLFSLTRVWSELIDKIRRRRLIIIFFS